MPEIAGKIRSGKAEIRPFLKSSCRNGKEAWELLELASYDVAVLDIMMPGNGWGRKQSGRIGFGSK